MGFGLFLLDSENTNISINKLDHKKRLRFEKLDRVGRVGKERSGQVKVGHVAWGRTGQG